MAADAPKKPQKQIENGDDEQQNGDQDRKQSQQMDAPVIQQPDLDPTGQRSQRTVEQQNKQMELVKANRRLQSQSVSRIL